MLEEWRIAPFDAGNDNITLLKLLPVIELLPFGSHPIKFQRQFVYHIVMRFYRPRDVALKCVGLVLIS